MLNNFFSRPAVRSTIKTVNKLGTHKAHTPQIKSVAVRNLSNSSKPSDLDMKKNSLFSKLINDKDTYKCESFFVRKPGHEAVFYKKHNAKGWKLATLGENHGITIRSLKACNKRFPNFTSRVLMPIVASKSTLGSALKLSGLGRTIGAVAREGLLITWPVITAVILMPIVLLTLTAIVIIIEGCVELAKEAAHKLKSKIAPKNLSKEPQTAVELKNITK